MSPRKNATDARDFVERATFVIVGGGLTAVPLLVFFFGFGNAGLLGVSLGIDHWIAFLTGPAVDIAAVSCVVASSYLSTKGWSEGRLWPLHLAAAALGLIMISLNTGGAVYAHHWRLAAFDSVGPVLLLGWGALAPWLWRNLTEARRQCVVQPATGHRDRPAAQAAKTDRSATSATSTPTAHPASHPDTRSATPRRAQSPRPSTPTDGQPTMDRWAEVGHPVYLRLKTATGKRPQQSAYRDALAEHVARLIDAGELPECYANPSLTTAKRVRTAVEERDTALSPVHLVPDESQEAS